jgi:hypothetical protein
MRNFESTPLYGETLFKMEFEVLQELLPNFDSVLYEISATPSPIYGLYYVHF